MLHGWVVSYDGTMLRVCYLLGSALLTTTAKHCAGMLARPGTVTRERGISRSKRLILTTDIISKSRGPIDVWLDNARRTLLKMGRGISTGSELWPGLLRRKLSLKRAVRRHLLLNGAKGGASRSKIILGLGLEQRLPYLIHLSAKKRRRQVNSTQVVGTAQGRKGILSLGPAGGALVPIWIRLC